MKYQAKRMEEVKLSEIRKVLAYANALESEGRDIIHLEIGEPDFDTPEHIKQAAIDALNKGMTHYENIVGTMALREAVADKLKKENNIEYSPDEILITNGVAEGIYLSILALLDEGDEILVPDPGYLSYFTVPTMCGVKVSTYPLVKETDFQVDYEELKKLVTPKTKMILLISPNNPTGTILYKESLEAIAKVAKENDLLVMADEIYEKLIYTNNEYISIASLPGMKERTLLLNGFSKYYAMTGWRIGYVAMDKAFMDVFVRAHFYNLSCLPMFTQYAAIQALVGDQKDAENMVKRYQARKDIAMRELLKIENIEVIEPEGAFYIFINVEKTGMNGEEISQYLLDEVGVATVPGNVFGENGENYIRISFALDDSRLLEAMTRIQEAINKIPRA